MVTVHLHHPTAFIRVLGPMIGTSSLCLDRNFRETPTMWPFVNLNSMPPFSLLMTTVMRGFCAENRDFVESKNPLVLVDQSGRPMRLEQLRASVA